MFMILNEGDYLRFNSIFHKALNEDIIAIFIPIFELFASYLKHILNLYLKPVSVHMMCCIYTMMHIFNSILAYH